MDAGANSIENSKPSIIANSPAKGGQPAIAETAAAPDATVPIAQLGLDDAEWPALQVWSVQHDCFCGRQPHRCQEGLDS